MSAGKPALQAEVRLEVGARSGHVRVELQIVESGGAVFGALHFTAFTSAEAYEFATVLEGLATKLRFHGAGELLRLEHKAAGVSRG